MESGFRNKFQCRQNVGNGADSVFNRSDFNNEGGMTTFDKREDGFEKKFAHDEELKFKAMARRNKLLGLWAAGLLGKSGADADAYAKEVVLADFEESGDNDVLRKVAKDLLGKGIDEKQIRAKMDELLDTAIEQVKKSG